MDTEDKLAWCEYGSNAEPVFASQRLFELGLAGHVNLNKKENKYTHDLFVQFPTDLKTVSTPLFKSEELYNIDPQYAITFNVKDGHRYAELYPNIVVVFDIKWEVLEMEINGKIYKVEPMHITIAGFLSDIKRAIIKCGKKQIQYLRRKDDTNGNAKSSWVFDARQLHRLN
jgi:hypothetical protein